MNSFILIAIGFLFHLKPYKIKISPFISVTSLKGFDTLSLIKKLYLLLLFFIAKLFLLLFFKAFNNKIFFILTYLHIFIFLLNLLPFPFLNGGKALEYILKQFFNYKVAKKILSLISQIFFYFLYFLGLLQIIFFNYNFSLLCLYVYLKKLYQKKLQEY